MKVYTYSEARQKLSAVLDTAKADGEVRIKRRDGGEFIVRPAQRRGSPLDIEGVDASVSASEIVEAVREVRERS